MGTKGSGKNTAATALVEKHGFTSLAFADPVKDACSSIFGWDRNLLEGNTIQSRKWREEIDSWWAKKLDIPHFTPRYAMQNLGTDLFRDNFHPDIWLYNMEKRLHNINDNIVISDGRFKNEIDLVRRLNGKVYIVQRGPEPEWSDVAKRANNGDNDAIKAMNDVFNVHESEYGWVGCDADGVIHNDSNIENLWKQIDEIIS